MDDDFEIEITDLRGEPVTARWRWLARRVDGQQQEDESFSIELTDLRADQAPARADVDQGVPPTGDDPRPVSSPLSVSPLAPHRGRRARLLGGASAATVLTVALAVLLLGSPVARGPLNTLFATPTATVPGADAFQVVNDVAWGKLTADGHAIAHTSYGGQPAFFRLDAGTHQLSFVAPPFPILRCRVSVPAAASDTCPLERDPSQSYLGNQPVHLEGVRVLDLRATVDNLPPEQRRQLIAATQALFASTQQQTTVNPGEHYLAGDQSVQKAQMALRATQAIELTADSTSAISINGESCTMICSVPIPADVFSGWALVATVTLGWQFLAPDGTLAAATLPQILAGSQAPATPIWLTAIWNSAWQVSFPNGSVIPAGQNQVPPDPTTATEAQVLCNAAQFAAGREITPSTDYGSIGWSGMAANPADGCVVVNQATNPEDQLVGQPEYLLYRFGVLLAASQEARQLNPDLPVADAAELALAHQAATASIPPQFTTGGNG